MNLYGTVNIMFKAGENRKRVIFLTLTLFMFISILILNRLTPMWGDDFDYSHVFGSDQKIGSLGDIIYSQYLHYMQWGGRTIAHLIAQFLLWIPPFFADALNSIAFLSLVLLVYLHAGGTFRKVDNKLYILSFFLVWLFCPNFFDVFLWITGSANYLWTLVLVLLFLLPFRLYKGEDLLTKSKSRYVCISVIFLGGVIAGWTNENTGLAVLSILLMWFLFCKNKKWKIPNWAIVGSIGFILGYLLLMLAPGNMVRAEQVGTNAFSFSLAKLYVRMNIFTDLFLVRLFPLILLSAVFVPLSRKKDASGSFRDNVFVVLIYFVGALVSCYSMLFSPTFSSRVWEVSSVFIIIPTLFSLNKVELFHRNKIEICLACFLLIAFTFDSHRLYEEVNDLNCQMENRTAIIIHEKNEGVDSLKVESVKVYGSKINMDDKGEWSAIMLSRYYGIDISVE